MEDEIVDIIDCLDEHEFQELIFLAEEPAEKDSLTLEKFKKLFARFDVSMGLISI